MRRGRHFRIWHDDGGGTPPNPAEGRNQFLNECRTDIEEARRSPAEQARTADLLRLIPKNRLSVLDIGARDGHFSHLLTQYFYEVTALDLARPTWSFPGVTTVAGDATVLDFPAGAFDVVFCAEVIEHIPGVERAAREIVRVAKHEVLIGVPFRQDTRVGRYTCLKCGLISPPWGHVHSFTESRLEGLFCPPLRPREVSFVGETPAGRTTAMATWLMDLGGNPWAAMCEEPCIHCGASRVRPTERTFGQRACSGIAHHFNELQRRVSRRPQPNWIHVLFER